MSLREMITSARCPGCAATFRPGLLALMPPNWGAVSFDCPACGGTIRFNWVLSSAIYLGSVLLAVCAMLPLYGSHAYDDEAAAAAVLLVSAAMGLLALRMLLLLSMRLRPGVVTFTAPDIEGARAQQRAAAIERTKAAKRRRKRH